MLLLLKKHFFPKKFVYGHFMAKFDLMAKYFFGGIHGQFMAKFRNLAMNMANLATLFLYVLREREPTVITINLKQALIFHI